MADKKELPFAILNILREYSDENHILTTSDIMMYLDKIYHFKVGCILSTVRTHI